MIPGFKVCPACGAKAELDASACSKCGHQFRTKFTTLPNQTQAFVRPASQPGPGFIGPGVPVGWILKPPGQHQPAAPILLSVLLGPWAGALFNGQTMKGIILMFLIPTLIVVGLTTIMVPAISLVILFVLPGLTYLAGIVDTALVAMRIQRGEAVDPWQFF